MTHITIENQGSEAMIKMIGKTAKSDTDNKATTKLQTFSSKQTLEGWRLSLSSAIDLTQELLDPTNLDKKYAFVLTAKQNQDALEVKQNIRQITSLY